MLNKNKAEVRYFNSPCYKGIQGNPAQKEEENMWANFDAQEMKKKQKKETIAVLVYVDKWS